ncbi:MULTISPECIES: hypothetical protein [Streptomyces]|uniref:Uncharacterized protein n=1 Tax=Streptomyces cremeus TaxID=66881 RepID=A0ABV5PPD4_STRCM
MNTTMTKTMLWMLLAIAVAANAFFNYRMNGTPQILCSVGAGIVALASIAGLVAVRRASSD